ncbi:hypothetical protein LWM68_12135 [Niabella sp. W65]|nr:hypothetical protein [Niabella sp. W65]MCH7363428.1 hypothetical protein [Niabella sp. W65]ULT39353.1 hypothetical protein KRR40_30920 [Niabella sp. I65]
MVAALAGTFVTAQSTTGDFKVSSTTQQGKQFPQVNSQGVVRVSIAAPQAKLVQLDIGGKKYDLQKIQRESGQVNRRPRM